MNLFLVTEHYRPEIGGLENSTAYLAEALNQKAHVEILTVAPQNRSHDTGPVPVRRFEATTQPPYAAMLDYLRQCQGTRSAVCFFGFSHHWTDAHLRFLQQVRQEVADCVTFKVPSLSEFSYYITTRERREMFLAADHVVCLNPGIREELVGAGVPVEKLRSLSNGVPCRHFSPVSVERKQALRRELGIPEGLVFIFTGRFAFRKRVHLLVEAFRQVPEVTLVLVGYFDDRFDSGSRIVFTPQDRTKICPPTADVRPFLQAADLFVSASAAEGMPNAVLEALACGVPALLSDIPGHREIITPGRTGWVFTPDDVTSLVECLGNIVKNRDCLSDYSRAARASVLERFTIDRVAQVYCQLLGIPS